MSDPNHPPPTPDDLLADFADRALEGKASDPADPELRDLEETVLRLQQSLPAGNLDEKTRRRMQAEFKVRARNVYTPPPSIWRSLRPPQRLTLAFAGAVLVILLIVFPFLPSAIEPVEGTAGLRPMDMLLLVSIACVTALLVWARRRK
jgi:hypothetical protein